MMINRDVNEYVANKLKVKLEDYQNSLLIPPPVFIQMKGNIIEYDEINKHMTIAFPISPGYLNPFGNMQGGMIAAAIDNTFGPLSMLVGPLNYTRHLEIKYRKPISPDLEYIIINARYISMNKRRLFFEANVSDKNKNELATAKAMHWVIDSSSSNK
jgi:acyl-coenzyme A thioesterase PaaI-like protein